MGSAQRNVEIQEERNEQEQQALELAAASQGKRAGRRARYRPGWQEREARGAVVGQTETKSQGSQQQMSGLPSLSPGQQEVEYQDDEKDVKAIDLGDDGLRPERRCHGKGDGRHDGNQAPDQWRKRREYLPQQGPGRGDRAEPPPAPPKSAENRFMR